MSGEAGVEELHCVVPTATTDAACRVLRTLLVIGHRPGRVGRRCAVPECPPAGKAHPGAFVQRWNP
eukprot:scaffold128144_cov36-Phaeocystis_antarctica.AAC.1